MRNVGSKLVVAVAVVFLAGAGGAARAADPVLTADVGAGDAFTIVLADASSSPVKHLDPGTYSLVVHDHSSFHNFHLSGPGVDVTTDVDAVGDRTFTVTFVDGTYFFQCDQHAAQMKGQFTVGAVTAPPPAAPPTPAKLAASIGPGKRFTFTGAAGVTVGAVVVTVKDRSATDGFRLSGLGVSKATGVKFRGTATWKLTLRAGTYRVGSLKNPKLRRTFTVS
jgi:hypothetical protein